MIKKGPTARQISQCPELLKRIRELEAEVERLEERSDRVLLDRETRSLRAEVERLRQERHLTACELEGLEGYDTDDGVYEAVKVLRADLARVTEERRYWRNEAKGIDSRLGTRIRELRGGA